MSHQFFFINTVFEKKQFMSKKIIVFVFIFILRSSVTNAQTTAMDFNHPDCVGNPHHLFADLDAGKVAVMEFFMTCPGCVLAGTYLETLHPLFAASNPGVVDFYAIAYSNTMACSTILNWIGTNSFSAIPIDSGADMLTYYGGLGMPTIVIASGSDHQIIYQKKGFTNNDTADIRGAITYATWHATAVSPIKNKTDEIKIWPNPVSNFLNIEVPESFASVYFFEIKDISGKRIKTYGKSNTSMKIDISDLADGEYLLTPWACYQEFPTQKFIVTHYKN